MGLQTYFESNNGFGVLSTADKAGRVDAAVYARPHINEEGKALFIMADKLSYSNLGQNPYACFLFKQEGPGYQGKRLFLKKLSATDDARIIDEMRRKCTMPHGDDAGNKKYLVTFEIEKEIPLVGSGEKPGPSCGCSCK